MQPAGTFADQWLIRTAQNKISGPWTKEEVSAKVLKGELEPQDEICKANSFWFFVHEKEELFSQLGVRVLKRPEDEVTETGSESLGGFHSKTRRLVQPGPPTPAHYSQPGTHPGTEYDQNDGDHGLDHEIKRPAPSQAAQIHVLGSIEKPSLWRGFSWVLAAIALLLVYLVLRTLRGGGPLF